MNNAANTVTLTNGTDAVTFTTERGDSNVEMKNSRGERDDMTRTEARGRIVTLLDAGWRLCS